MKLVFAPRAQDELAHAYDWYEEQQAGLGGRLLWIVKNLTSRLLRYPRAYPLDNRNRRVASLGTFPYVVVYIVEDDTVVIVAIVHTSRNPEERQR